MGKLFLYNTFTRQQEEFVPLDSHHVKMYVCGPTVYDYAHIGNARPVIIFDTLYRLLRLNYPKVTYVRNITDVDDKINAAALEKKQSIQEITATTIKAYSEDMAALNTLSPDIEPKATEHIDVMIEMIKELVEKGYAYEVEGSVLFNVQQYSDYGQLSRRSLEEMQAGARVEVALYKKDPADFVLWKPSTPELPGWESPWGRGRPGWHIECSAMSTKHLGKCFDIHGGGLDLIFPHHENERAQSCAFHRQKEFVRYWLHNGWVTVEGEKMSKSLGNFITVHQLLKSFPGEVIRLALMNSHYRQPLNWTTHGIQQAKNVLDRFYLALRPWTVEELETDAYPEQVLIALQKDLNIPSALRELQELLAEFNNTAEGQRLPLAKMLKKGGELLGILQTSPNQWFQETLQSSSLSKEAIEGLIEQRCQARLEKNYEKADMLRKQLEEAGITLEDTPQGTQWRY